MSDEMDVRWIPFSRAAEGELLAQRLCWKCAGFGRLGGPWYMPWGKKCDQCLGGGKEAAVVADRQ